MQTRLICQFGDSLYTIYVQLTFENQENTD